MKCINHIVRHNKNAHTHKREKLAATARICPGQIGNIKYKTRSNCRKKQLPPKRASRHSPPPNTTLKDTHRSACAGVTRFAHSL